VLIAAALAAGAVVLQGCGGGGAAPKPDLMTMLCSDATATAVESTDLVHEHLDEIQNTCKSDTDPDSVKGCEDGKIAGIDAAEENITKFYTTHCVEHVTEWLGDNETTLELLHTYADQFETTHKDEITAELHAGIHRGIEKGKAGAQSSFDIVCIHEVEKEVQSNGDLVHEHLKEIEQGCAGKEDVLKCEDISAKGVIGAMVEVTSEYQDHCKDPTTWSLWAVHPAVDNFATVHKDEIKDELHKAIHEAMKATGSGGDMISALCSDATAKDVEATDLVHEHLDEVQDMCKSDTDPDSVKSCEDGKIAGIDAAEENITNFYVKHCEEHVKEWLGKNETTLELIHTLADRFETTHKAEIEKELHDGIHRGMEEGKAGGKTMLEIVCTHEVEKEVERDDGLVHDHLKEMEGVCKDKDDIAKCEANAANNIVEAKEKIISDYIDHCKDPASWSLWAIHPAVDNFATVHKDEIKTTLHKEIHNAMSKEGLESATAAFLLPRVPVAQATSFPLGVACALLVMVAVGLAATVGAAGRFTRQRALPLMDQQHQESSDAEDPQEMLFLKQ